MDNIKIHEYLKKIGYLKFSRSKQITNLNIRLRRNNHEFYEFSGYPLCTRAYP